MYWYMAIGFVWTLLIFYIGRKRGIKIMQKFFGINKNIYKDAFKHKFYGKQISVIPLRIISARLIDVETKIRIFNELSTSNPDFMFGGFTVDLVTPEVVLKVEDIAGQVETFTTSNLELIHLKPSDSVYGLYCGERLYGIAVKPNMLIRSIVMNAIEKVVTTVSNKTIQEILKKSEESFPANDLPIPKNPANQDRKKLLN